MQIELRGLNWTVQRWGVGAPLLCLHGFTGSAEEWAAQRPDWSSEFDVIAPDLPGHGRTGIPDDEARGSMEETAASLEALLDALGLQQVSVLGYSMGGRLALYFAVTRPTRVQALVLESASPGLADPADREARRQSDYDLAQRILQDGVPAFVDHWESMPLWASQSKLPPSVREGLCQRRLQNDARNLAWSLQALGIGTQPALHQLLWALNRPVLCMAGTLDPKFALLAQEMAAALPQAELMLIPDAGHAIHLEHPQLFANATAAFLRQHRG